MSLRLRAVRSYGLAVVSVAAAALMMHLLKPLTAEDTRPALLVAVAIGALYGGLGSGLLALVLAGVVAPDPIVITAGAALVALCVGFRRARSAARPSEQLAGSEPGAPDRRPERQGPSPIPPPEISRTAPTEVTTEATWRFWHEQPLDITLPEDEQVEHLYLYSVLAECNDAFARMYGFRSATDVIGTRLVVFLPPSNSENVAYLRSFIRSGYRLEDAESHEIDRYGNSKYFVNNLVGIFERGELVGAWGTQRDVTGTKRADGSQEYRSRVHSSKSSLQ
jgi:hypothetical protein